MEDTRIALKEGTLLSVSNREKGAVTYTIGKVKGRGMSGIVYDASYQDNRGYRHAVLIKECYPFEADIYRDGNRLVPGSELDERIFRECKREMEASYGLHNELFHTDGLTNYISNTIDNYTENNTIYTVLTYQEGEVLSRKKIDSIKECVTIVKRVAAFLGRMHERGYLYLDVKPENILVLEGSPQAVQLFDFDTPIRLSDIRKSRNREEGGSGRINRLACTKGFAAYEQKKGQLNSLGRHTDVYGVGALLFWLLFGRVPEAPDCETGAEYKFAHCRFADRNYQDRLFQVLPDFFRHTLTDFCPDRYQDMDQVIRKLEEIERYAETVVPFIISSQVNRPPALFGRERELKALEQWLDADKTNCLFLTGMGGMGKSTLVRGYIADHRSRFDAVLYLYYNDSIQKMITDDSQLRVNIVEKTMEESTSDYFHRKLRVLRDLAAGRRILLVVDNFDGEPDEDFSAILDIGWKVIVVSRLEIPKTGYATLALKAISDRADLYDLFECYVGRGLDDEELSCVDEMIRRVFGHTLALQLIARQVACSHISVAQATALLREKGFSDIAPEKVDYVKDWRLYQDTVADIIGVIFQAGEMEEQKKMILKVLSLFSSEGVDINIFSNMIGLNSKDAIKELARECWLQLGGTKLSLHPVVQEVIRRWEWTELCRGVFEAVMESLYAHIKIESGKEEYPMELLRMFQREKEYMEKYEILRRKIEKHNAKKGVIGAIILKRVADSDKRQVTDHRKQQLWLRMAENVLDSCRKEEILWRDDNYRNVLYCTIIYMARDREEYILEHADELLDGFRRTDGIAYLKICERVISIYEERGAFAQAYTEVEKARKSLKIVLRKSSIFTKTGRRLKRGREYVKGMFYYILAKYYGSVANWGFYYEDRAEEIDKMLNAINKAIRYMKRDRGKCADSRAMHAKYLLFKANVLIQCFPQKRNDIEKLLSKSKRLVEKYTQEHSRLRYNYKSVEAWYHTRVDFDYAGMMRLMGEACKIAIAICGTDLDIIDGIIIPWANMFFEWGKYEDMDKMLRIGIGICEEEEHREIIPYIRKKRDLYRHLLEAYQKIRDLEKCREVEKSIEEEKEGRREGVEIADGG